MQFADKVVLVTGNGQGLGFGMAHYQRLIDGYIAGAPIEKLAAATNLLGGNFDGKVKDLGF